MWGEYYTMNVDEVVFSENISLMLEKSKDEPIFIIVDEEPKYVLLSFEAYNQLIENQPVG